MKTKLIAVTKPLDIAIKTAEDLLVYVARVSNPNNQTNLETGARLLRYCIAHGHWSVFESASMTIEIKTSRAIAAQILRHRSFTFQEFSQRYSVANAWEIYAPRLKSPGGNRQGSFMPDNFTETQKELLVEYQYKIADAFKCYDKMIDAGFAPESARMVLPLCTQTTLYMTGTVRSWIHYLKQRLDTHAQLEHRQVAQSIEQIFRIEFPITWSAVFGEQAI